MTNPNPNYRKNIKPGLTVPSGQSPEMEKFLQGVKEHLQGGDGTRGQPLERFVTLDDLQRAGLIKTGVKNGRGVITEVFAGSSASTSAATASAADLADLGDVLTTPPITDGSVLIFDAVAARWENGVVADSSEIEWTYDSISPSLTASIVASSLVYAKVQDASALSVLGRSANSTGVLDEITAASDGDILRRSGTAIGFGSIVETAITDGTLLARVAGNETISGDWTFTGEFNIGDPGTESGTISVNGVSFSAVAKINEFGGTQDAELVLHRHATSAPANLVFARSRGTTATHANVQDGDILGRMVFVGHVTSSYYWGASIWAEIDGTPGVSDMPSAIVFGTTADGATTPTERFRISPAGALGVNGETYGTANQSVLMSGGSAAAPSWSNNVPLKDASNIFTSSGTADAAILLSSAAPTSRWDETDAAADNRVWRLQFQSEQLRWGVVSDDLATVVNFMTVDRTAAAVDDVALSATTVEVTGKDFVVGHTAQLNATANRGNVTVNGTSSAIYQLATGGARRAYLFHDGTDFTIDNTQNGTLVLATNDATQVTISVARSAFEAPVRLKGYTVAGLPAGTAGDTAYATDALAPVFGAAVAGGGAVVVPVYYTGAAWFVG